MSNKDKDSKSLPDKVKEFFRRNKTSAGGSIGKNEYNLTDDCLKDLSRDSPLSTRLKILRELCETVSTNKLENNAVEKLWSATEDLLYRDQTTETRHSVFKFLQCLIKGQNDRLKLMRAQFFRFIKLHDAPEDVAYRLDLLICLTSNGKDILYFEDEVGKFLLNWLPDISRAGKIQEYLYMMDNVIKFNAAYLDEDVFNGFIQHLCLLMSNLGDVNTINICLQIMSSIVAYSNMSPDSLPNFIGALCRTVNVESYCDPSWRIMKTLLGTHMGHSALYTMCKILQEPCFKSETYLLRGAVFYIHMALWSLQPISQLHCPPSSVLPSFLHAVKCNQPAVSYEAILGIYQLVNRHYHELQDPSWSILFDILLLIIKQIYSAPQQTPNNLMIKPLQDTLTIIERLHSDDLFNGSTKQFFSIIEECASTRPELSVSRLISYLAESIVPTEHLWLNQLWSLMHKYFKSDERTNIRLKVLSILSDVIKLNRRQYEDEIIDCIIIPNLSNISNDNDVVVRSEVAKLLLVLCIECESKKCIEILDILEKLLKRPFDCHLPDTPLTETECQDIRCLVTGLINVFTVKIHKLPSTHAVKIYVMLVTFLELHYSRPKIFDNCHQIRLEVFNCFLKMRADNLYHLGCPNANNVMKYSPYLCVTYKSTERGPLGSPPPQSPAITPQSPACTITYVPLRRAFKIFITCLRLERDWEVLKFVLQEMEQVLQNKSLILSKQGNTDLNLLVAELCGMMSDKTLYQQFNSLPDTLNVQVHRTDFCSAVLIVLVGLASYHSFIDQQHQQKMIRCLTKCNQMNPRCSKDCINALTLCTLEMRDVMVKMLPDVLLSLSKTSATAAVAIPVLEFLSTLTQLPMVFANFVADQYMAVFAISLPYTTPFKYDHFIVSLAHHVIAVWFLKCRLPFRRDFVKFIKNGLQTNVSIPFEEQTILKSDLASLNEDSSDRKRSSSFTEQSTRQKLRSVQFRPQEKTLQVFYTELTETCIDLMARYAYSPCSALPKRLPTAEFLLNGGQSMCWMIGNKLVTVTTSGCSQKVLKHGLCDKCWMLCNSQNEGKVLRTARSSSNENQDNSFATRQNSNDKSNTNTSASSPLDETKKISDKLDTLSTKLQQLAGPENREKQLCACWCQGWAEVYVRRPTGDMSWVMRIQNDISYQHTMYEFPYNEISTLFMPSLTGNSGNKVLTRQSTSEETNQADEEQKGTSAPDTPTKQSPSRQNSRDSVEEDSECIYDDGTKSRNPVRRSNSSPEMSANWKNPFTQKGAATSGDSEAKSQEDDNMKKNKMYSKDMRVSCEAIPEEMAGSGTTPPSNDSFQSSTATASNHPSLLSCHSYPGSSPPKDPNIRSKPYQTVPHSPNIQTSNVHPDFTKSNDLKPYKTGSIESMGSDKSLNLCTKPPQSPTQTSPRLARHSLTNNLQKSSSSSVIERNTSNLSLNLAREMARDRKNNGGNILPSDFNQTQQLRDRVHTISVINATLHNKQNTRGSNLARAQSNRTKEVPKSGINPSFVFLQLYHSSSFGNSLNERPMLVSSSDVVQRAVNILDGIPPYETHKIGVIYVREGQVNNEVDILRNQFGSIRYVEFLQNLGSLVRLADVDPCVFFLGGLDQRGSDGKFAYVWQDDVVRVAFHVATMMPNKESDPNCNDKKLHIGNNYVTIVYNESGEDFNINTIKGQYNYACIIIQPLEHNTNRVTVKTKKELEKMYSAGNPKTVSDQNVAILAKQLALHANLASLVASSLKHSQDPYASNWLERLRKIKNIRNKIIQENKKEDNPFDDTNRLKKIDFTDYT